MGHAILFVRENHLEARNNLAQLHIKRGEWGKARGLRRNQICPTYSKWSMCRKKQKTGQNHAKTTWCYVLGAIEKLHKTCPQFATKRADHPLWQMLWGQRSDGQDLGYSAQPLVTICWGSKVRWVKQHPQRHVKTSELCGLRHLGLIVAKTSSSIWWLVTVPQWVR